MLNTNAAKDVTKFNDIIAARDAAKIFMRRGTPVSVLAHTGACLQASGLIGIKTVAAMLNTLPELPPESRSVILHISAAFLLSGTPKADDFLVKGLAMLLNYSDVSVRTQALKILLAIGERAAASQDFALGCIRNNDAAIRLGGAQLLHSLGTACSRSLVRQMHAAVERYPADTEFCNKLRETIELLNNLH